MNSEVVDKTESFACDMKGFIAINNLKGVTRYSERPFNGRSESSADHSWGCIIVAEYLFLQLEALCPGQYALDKLKVQRLLAFHDLLEAYTCHEGGDVDSDPADYARQATKESIEASSLPKFLTTIPPILVPLYKDLLSEYNEKETLESKFANLVDLLEAEFRVFDLKHMFKNWNESYFIDKREKYFDAFPELKYIFYEVLRHHRDNGYFSQ